MPKNSPTLDLLAPVSVAMSLVCPDQVEQRAGKIGEVETAPRQEYVDADGETRSYPLWTDYIASTAGENRNDDWLETGQMILKFYRANPVVMAMHNRRSWPVGTGKPRLSGTGDDAVLYLRVQWDLEDPETRKIVGKVDRRVLRAGSIGAMLGKGSAYRWSLDPSHKAYKENSMGRYVAHPVLEEFSIVPLPGDRTARAISQDITTTTPPVPPAPTTTPGQSMNYQLLLCSVLALSTESTDDEIQAAADAHPDHKARADAAEDACRLALSLDADAELPAELAAELTAATDRSGMISLAEATQMVLDATAAAATDPKITALAEVKSAVKDGRITPALVAHWEGMAAVSPTACMAALEGIKPSSAVPLTAQVDPTKPPPTPVALSAHDRLIVKQLGITEAEFITSMQGA